MSQIHHALGPFAPPKEYSFEPELMGKLPRLVPPELRQGHHGLTAYGRMRAFLIIGFLCIASAETAFMKTASCYFLPLTFTRWIGVAFLLGAAFEYLRDAREGGPYRYVKAGTPFVARVVQLVCQPTLYYNGSPTQWKISAGIEYQDAGGAVVSAVTPSFELGNAPHQYTTSFKVGDYVTGLYLPDAPPDEQRRLYGFLGLKPGLGVIPRVAGRQKQLADQIKVIGGVFLLLFALFATLFYGCRAFPLEAPGPYYWLGCLAVSLCAAVPLHRKLSARAAERVAAWNLAQASAHQKGEVLLHDPRGASTPRPHTKGGTVLVTLLVYIGVLFVVVWLNALLDRSAGEDVPLYVDQLIHTTWNGCIREYSIKYKRLDLKTGKPYGSPSSFATTAAHMETFKTRLAIGHVSDGAFGWKWMKSLEPFNRE